ncbi:hypothetical protein S40285_04855 [Stachybotrys chlorohalonatus IBT 40285]|uniref:YAG7-like dimerisation domain-containing protein n=1 Tax=Stachybotrys chlorohalonatus (strain IBT 40285) TaxID=1283841 RepID=A0A084QA91_STAC4|nr:hypothetical protein S40285_04855 [Stachybotrys chlorohalonata IBT 40285]
MAAPAAQSGSKSSKKKVAPVIERTDSPAPSVGSGLPERSGDSTGDSFESPYIKELQKNIRNINKKLAHTSKTDAVIAQHPGRSLDDLVASKIINNDQKAQILKKPALQAQIIQFEEQLTQYQKVQEQYQERAAADKAEWEKALEKAKADALAEAKEEAEKKERGDLLVLSQFLRLAAYRREEAKDPESDESQAIEGVLLAIYSGDENAVAAMLKLFEGSSDQIWSVPGEQLQTTYSQVKVLAQDYTAPVYDENATAGEAEPAKDVATDPTVAHASATEIAAGDIPAPAEIAAQPAANGIANTNVTDDAANAVAESHWDSTNDMTMSQEWVDVKVPRDPTETETGLDATPAAVPNTQSWADDHPDPVPEANMIPQPGSAPADPNDGFHQVQRNRGRHDREGGGYRGRGRGEWRSSGGHRGDGRGRGRGRGNRGGSGAPSRGPRRTEES